ncbi:hypothetical protein SH2C18_47120 [Clostridium sediminicola]|uniref:hypothetical protein n=1 Tax=Clostridium sediminicola TaxID=3114879 RepID=UPI0031F1CCD1
MINIFGKMKIVKYNIEVLFGVNIIIAVLYGCLIPLAFSFKNINYVEIIKISELYVPLIGIILLSYITSIEKTNIIEELSFVKKISSNFIFLIRFFINTVFIILILVLLFLYAKYQGAAFTFSKVFIGSLVTAIYLGLVALTMYNLTKNLAVGYMISFGYYFFEFSTKGKYTKELYLFSLLKDSFTEKIYLSVCIVILFLINLIIIKYKSQNL